MEQFVARVHLRQLILVSGLEVHRKQLDIGPANAFPSPLSSLPFEVGPSNTARESGGALWDPPAGSAAEPQWKSVEIGGF